MRAWDLGFKAWGLGFRVEGFVACMGFAFRGLGSTGVYRAICGY